MADNSLQGGADSIRDIDRSGIGPKTQVFQLDHAGAGASESLTSATNPLPSYGPDITATGNLAAAAQTVVIAPTGGFSVLRIQITGTWVGTIGFEATVDGTNWISVNAVQAGSTVIPQSTTTNGVFSPTPAGFASFRANMTAWTSGTAVVTIRASRGHGGTYLNQALPSFAVIPAVKTDLTTPGTTNLVSIGTGGTVGLVAGAAVIGAVTQSGTWNVGTITTLPALATGANVIGSLAANQSSNVAQINGVAPLMGTGISGTGALRVTLATDIALPTGTNTIGALTANQTVNNAQIGGVAPLMGNGVTGTGSQRVTIASDNTPYPVKIDQTITGTTNLVVASQIAGANSTTGDSGAKTVTGTGAIQGNTGNKGVQVVINMGAVTGTTPTFVGKIQGSADGGTTFYDIPGATTASLTATGVFGITVYPGIAVTAGTTTTGTTATANMPLPRVWRVVWTIGGTSPSFAITSVQYNYLVN